MEKNPMPEQDPIVRAGNFDEVALGYTPEMAIDEAKRRLNCPNPLCRTGCPVSVRIPEFIAKVVEGDFDAAYEIITSTNSCLLFPAVFALRKDSANLSVSAASRASLSVSAVSSALLLTTT